MQCIDLRRLARRAEGMRCQQTQLREGFRQDPISRGCACLEGHGERCHCTECRNTLGAPQGPFMCLGAGQTFMHYCSY